MKKIFFLIAILFAGLNVFSQFPMSFNYQAVARNDDGSPLKNKQIAVEVSILKGNDCINSGGCELVWQEIHFPTTNEFGLFNIEIGEGQSTFAGSAPDFDSIKWGDLSGGNYFLKIRVDFGNSPSGNSLQDMGIVKFLSVPYSLSSKDIARDNSGKVPISLFELSDVNLSSLAANQVLMWDGSQWINTTASGGSPVALNDLTDVTLSGTNAGQVLFYDGTQWTNSDLAINDLSDVSAAPSAGQVLRWNGTVWSSDNLNITDLADVNITSPATGQALVWDGTNWINQTPTASSVWQQSGTSIFYKNGAVGIDTVPNYWFHVFLPDNKSVVFTGEFDNTLTVPALQSGHSYFWFYPAKSSLRVGYLSATEWSSIGDYSVSFGKGNSSPAVGSFTVGQGNTTNGDFSFAGGLNNTANGWRTFAYGEGLEANALLSFVVGRYNDASSQNGNTWYAVNQLFVVGNGTDATTRHNAFVIRKDGSAYLQDSLYQKSPNPTKAVKFSKPVLPQVLDIDPVITYSAKGQGFGIDYKSLQETFPNLTTTAFNSGEPAINYIGLIPVLLKAIQEQQNLISELQKENAKLNERLTKLEQNSQK